MIEHTYETDALSGLLAVQSEDGHAQEPQVGHILRATLEDSTVSVFDVLVCSMQPFKYPMRIGRRQSPCLPLLRGLV
jgi:hypothetical protein